MVVGNTSHVAPNEQVAGSNSVENQEPPQPQDLDGEGNRSFKDKIRHPFPELRHKLKGTHLYDAKIEAIHMKHQVGKFQNLFNSNHRHDEEHEQITDKKRTLIGESHRFQSFAPERDGNQVKWYVGKC